MSADPNTLITTIIATTSSIVSITGAFMVSRLIALSSEKNGYKAKISELQKEVNALQSSIDEIDERTLKSDRQWFFDHALKGVIDEARPLEVLIQDREINLNSRSIEDLRPTFNLIHQIFADLYENIMSQPDGTKFPETFQEFVSKTKINYKKEYEDYYSSIYTHLMESRMTPIQRAIMSFPITHLPYIPRSGKTRTEIEEELNLKNSIIESTHQSMSRLGKPEGIKSGLCFIIVSILAGIVYPVCLLPMEPQSFTIWVKGALLAAIFLVLAYFVTYLIYLINRSHEIR